MNSFHFNKAIIEDFYEFKDCLTNFVCHIENQILKTSIPAIEHKNMYWHYCLQAFDAEFGSGSEKTAFEIARTGNEGGLYNIFKIVAQKISKKYIDQWITHKVLSYWNGLTVDEQLSAPSEYIDKFGHLLPSEMLEGSSARIKANFTKVLIKHPVIIKKLRNP